MSSSFHYLVMAEHSIFQKKLIAKLKGTGLTSGQPKVLDYLKDHDGASQKSSHPGRLQTIKKDTNPVTTAAAIQIGESPCLSSVISLWISRVISWSPC